MGGRQQAVARMAMTISNFSRYSTAPSKCWTCPIIDSNGNSRCKQCKVRALSNLNAQPLSGPRLKCAGASARDGKLMPLFLRGNSTQTTQHFFRILQSIKFPYCCADVAKESGWKGNNVYDVNQWLWHFERGKPRLGVLSVSETDQRGWL